jgi:hypothetical protein
MRKPRGPRDNIKNKYSDALVLTEGRTRKHVIEIKTEPVFHSMFKRISDSVVKRISDPILIIAGDSFKVKV